jgi:hypothetical protein
MGVELRPSELGNSNWKYRYEFPTFVLTAVVMKNSIFSELTPCSQLKVNRHFVGTFLLKLQGRTISQARSHHEAGSKQTSGFLPGLFFDTEVGGDIFLRNVG